MNLLDLYNKTEEAKKFVLSYNKKIVNYRIYDKINKMSYIGTASNLWQRLYNGRFGHVGSIFRKVRHDFIHLKIIEIGLENFEFFIERDDFSTIQEAETNEALLISKYDSFLNGYNLTINGKGGYVGTIQLTNPIDKTTIRVKPNAVDDYLAKGWKKGSNRKVVTDPKTGKFYRISSEEADSLVNNKGWTYGSKLLSTTKGSRSITNMSTGETKKVLPSEVNQYLSEGWELGFGPNKGKKYVTNIKTNQVKRIPPDKIDEYLSEGWELGFGPNKKK